MNSRAEMVEQVVAQEDTNPTSPASTSSPPTGGDSDAQVVPTLGLAVANHGRQQPSSSQASARISAVALFFLRLKNGGFLEARPTISCYTTTKLHTFYQLALSNSRLPRVNAELTDVLLLDRKFEFFVDVSMESVVQDCVVYQFRLLEEGAFRTAPECPKRLQTAMRASLVDGRPGGEQNTNNVASGNVVETSSLAAEIDSGPQKATVVEDTQASAILVTTSSGSSDPVATRKRKADTTEGLPNMRDGSKGCPSFTHLLPLLLTSFDFCLPPEYVQEADRLRGDSDAATTTNFASDPWKEHINEDLVAKAASTKHVEVKKACNGHAHASGPKQISQKKKPFKANRTAKKLQGTHPMPENKAPQSVAVPSSSSSSRTASLPSLSEIEPISLELK